MLTTSSSIVIRDIHRIGGANVDNLRLKPREAALEIPGISVLRAGSPQEAARQIRAAFPKAWALHEASRVVGSTTHELIQSAGFDLIVAPSTTLPNHYRIVHPAGAAGFSDENLVRLAAVFEDTTGIGP